MLANMQVIVKQIIQETATVKRFLLTLQSINCFPSFSGGSHITTFVPHETGPIYANDAHPKFLGKRLFSVNEYSTLLDYFSFRNTNAARAYNRVVSTSSEMSTYSSA